MTLPAKRIVDSKPFRAIIIAVILLVGVESSAAMLAQHGALLHALDVAVLAIFIIEIVLKLAAHGRRPLDYFRDGWNVFDFTIVALCILPVGGPFAAVLRLVRTLRLLRLVTALMMIPYVVIGMMGGGHTLDSLSDGWVPYWLGGAIVAVVVMLYVFFGGMRGVAWVNALQTVLFLCFGAIAFYLIWRNLGGYDRIMAEIAADPKGSALLTRARISPQEFFSCTFIPLSAMMFPHMAIMCLTAEKVTSFKRTVVWYPICILLIWLPSVYLGIVAAHQFPGPKLGESDVVILRLLGDNTDVIVAGILGAAIMACVMATDSQIMALSTMFSQDVFVHYGGATKYGENVQVWMGRAFVIVIAIVSHVLALALEGQKSIFDLAIGFGFSGFAALAPVMLAALFWRRSNKWEALAAVVWVVFTRPCSGGCNCTRTPRPQARPATRAHLRRTRQPLPPHADECDHLRLHARDVHVPRLRVLDGAREPPHPRAVASHD